MISHDFEHGKFPICRRAPVICFFENGLRIIYNRYDLYNFLNKNGLTCRCIGVWPGKKSTDCFVLNPKSYSTIDIPPEMHKEIDSAEGIVVKLSSDGIFEELTYTPGTFAEDRTPVLSKEIKLFEYVKKSGLKFSTLLL
jgi:hypothetical protein